MPTRPARTKVRDWPGTRERYGNKCANCHRHATPEDQPPRMSLNEIRSGLEAFITARRNREAAMMRRDYYEEMSRA